MSVKRILGVTVFGVLFIMSVTGAMLMISYFRRDVDAISLPDAPTSSAPSVVIEPDEWGRVEITRDTVQSVVMQTLSRPDTYSRNVIIDTYWDGGQAAYNININVTDGMTALRVYQPSGIEKRIIVTSENLYV